MNKLVLLAIIAVLAVCEEGRIDIDKSDFFAKDLLC